MTTFNFAKLPELYFGAGSISRLPGLAKTFGSKVVLITGSKSFISTPTGERIINEMISGGVDIAHFKIGQEPSPAMVDDIVTASPETDVVVAIGGGSVLDAGKAVAAMIPVKDTVSDYLEGVGTKSHPGQKIPFMAIPTTSGTGSEATKNAVLSENGSNGFKRSLRHNNFVPDVAIVDPDLTISCSPYVTACSGMDAFTQLLESFLSTNSNPVTDALAIEGLQRVSASLLTTFREPENTSARADMAFAAYLSGITLANAGLGLVHGLAGVIGGWHNIAHGQICSALMPQANAITVRKLRQFGNGSALQKYVSAGKVFSAEENRSNDYYIDSFIDLQFQFREALQIPALNKELSHEQMVRVAYAADDKNNPVKLTPEERLEVLTAS